ncbi:Flagellar biosynthetic protein FliR [Candidatus Methylobacter favarea]|uniref:Flagellar biosynthetic protein FliR n=1 Tax=Candidatus Methylobacter favarea TaxID=2707345 RepID=A0A8S0XIQ0_9GAMM|nr:flagellar biosynthetic protein FliR [Candidatus Methylobacter favarea]CAA9890986.1 Flagellar biosynthetic protein FliR [Candidatus Methylobacter favarea]
MHFTEAQVFGQVASFIWPLLRITAMFIAVPVFSIRAVPARVRLILAVAITFVVMPLLPALPAVEMFSYEGGMVAIAQVMIGLVSGFIVQLVFSSVIFAGQGIALSMGLGFASLIDPQNGQQVPVVAQFYVIISTLIFFNLDGHLLLIKMLLDSFTTLPIGVEGVAKADIWVIIGWSSRMFAVGLLLAMPVIVSLLLVNVSFGVATRAAPQLNIFSVGFPVTLMLGILLMWLTLPEVSEQIAGLLTNAYELLGQLLKL